MHRLWISTFLFAVILSLSFAKTANAELTTAQRREIASLKKKVSRVGALIRSKRLDDAKEIVEEAEKAIDEIVKAAEIERTDRALKSILADIKRHQESFSKPTGSKPSSVASKVHFLDDVAPLIDSKCLGCHGATNPRAGLRLDTLAGWRRGGRSGPLLQRGNAGRSTIIARLIAPAGQGRMPQRGEPLSREEIALIGNWINQGANVGNSGPNLTLSDLIYEREKKTLMVEIPKPKGTETVSFTRDMAPWMTNLCLNCHNSRNKSGGLSVETFYDLMKGGESGEVILPGDMDSRFFRLVGGLELPRMPQGQARITRQNYEDMKTWFREGNTFDGSDPRTNIRTYVRSAADIAADEFRKKTNEEMLVHRRESSLSQLKKAVPNDSQTSVDTEHFLMVGNVNEARLQEVGGWAEEKLGELHKLFGGTGQPWRGKLAIFVLKDRFSYDEFNEVVEQRRADSKMMGHSKVTTNHEDAYAVLQDVDNADASELTTQKNLFEHLTGAYLQQNGATLPSWVVSGTGLIMAIDARNDPKRIAEMKQLAASIVPTIQRPEDVFDGGTFSPGTIGAVGYTLVRYLIDSQGTPKYAQFVKELQQGQPLEQALQRVYGSSPQQVARGYATSLNR